LQVSDIAGIRALIVHAKNDAARQWYIEWEFEPSPTPVFDSRGFMKFQDTCQ